MIKKNISVIFLFILLTSIAYSQYKIEKINQSSRNITFDLTLSSINHTLVKTQSGGNEVNFTGFSDESKPGSPGLPNKIIFVALPSISKITVSSTILSSEKIKGVPQLNPLVRMKTDSTLVYQKVTRLAAAAFQNSSNAVEVAGYLWIRNYYCAAIRINQYRYNYTNYIEQINKIHLEINVGQPDIVSQTINTKKDPFDGTLSHLILNYNNSPRLQRRKNSAKSDSLTSWIDFSNTYIKIGVNHDGIYRISSSDLTNYAVDYEAIDPNNFKIISRGKEVPIYIHYVSPNSPASWDYIEFFGFRNMGADYKKTNAYNTPYNEYLDRYSDTTVYWFTWNGNAGKRIDTLTHYTGSAKDSVLSYTEITHNEDNAWFDYSVADIVRRQDPEWIENETWVGGQQGVGNSALSFSVNDVVPGKSADAYYKVQNFASDVDLNAHKVGLTLNNNPAVYGTVNINKYEQKVIHGNFPVSILNNGSNTLHAISYQTSATLNSMEYDWYEIDYPRYLKAYNDSLEFQINDTLKNQPAAIKVTNLSGQAYTLYKISGGLKKISNFTLSKNTLTFIDTVYPGSKYYLIAASKIGKPHFFYKKNFVDIGTNTNQADYILITHPLLLNEAAKYSDFINRNYNVSTKIINIFDIYDEYNYGFFSPAPIKYFLQTAFNNWKAPQPSYVFLVGEANYDYYGNKVKYFGTPVKPNYVPSYGIPVSDTWFVVWDTTGLNIPQMCIGRLPVSSEADFDNYLQRHKSYLASPFDDWNKRYLFFSGGDPANPSELTLLKSVNDQLINTIINVYPIGGICNHFYKTITPSANFGPFTNDQISAKLDSGGVVLSYIGHSGTQIWDNGINDPLQVGNNRARFTFVTDFGCSTGKFAEPDIKSFAELFVAGSHANAIGFVGNTSLGFTSTTTTFPQLFYKRLISKDNPSIGEAYLNAKTDLIQQYGSTDVFRIFTLCNTLFADPIIKLKIPTKPNLFIDKNGIKLNNAIVESSTDSIKVMVKYFNYGIADTAKFTIRVISYYNDQNVYEKKIIKSIPLFSDSLSLYIKIKNQIGAHKISVILDSDNNIDEIYKTDNTAELQYNVVSIDIRTLFLDNVDNINNTVIKFINPTGTAAADSIVVQLDTKQAFSLSVTKTYALGMFYSKIDLSPLLPNIRYWLRVKLKNQTAEYSGPFTFYYSLQVQNALLLNDSLSFSNGKSNSVQFVKDGLVTGNIIKKLTASSAGFYDGGYATTTVNGNDYLSEGNVDGPHIAAFDNNLNFLYEKRFSYWDDPVNFEKNFLAYMDSVSTNNIVVFSNSGGGGSGLTAKITSAIKNFGSKYIDNIGYRYSWAMIGRKGAKPGSMPEVWSKPFAGAVTVDSLFTSQSINGSYTSPLFGPVGNWKSINISAKNNNNSQISIYPVVKNVNSTDTLSALPIINNSANLSSLSKYSFLQFLLKINKGTGQSPAVLNSLQINYTSLPELGTNYQAVSIVKDTVVQGEYIDLTFSVYNAGGSAASNFRVIVEAVKPDNSKEKVFDTVVDSIGVEQKKQFIYSYLTTSECGRIRFNITIDPDNKILELYKDNNFYSIPAFVKTNDKPASMKVTFDGSDIVDGDYISVKPDIKVELNDMSLVPITDTTVIRFYLNGQRIYFANNPNVLIPAYSSANPKLVVIYKPALTSGNYTFKVWTRSVTGQASDSVVVTRKFQVDSELKLLDVFNYPNPFSKETFFTFKLTQIPDELKIRIFTVAGRLIKEFVLSSADLRCDFNRILWNGRDQDGDFIANGVYLYKIVTVKNGIKSSVIQKLAVVR
jgi:hypothetical protein